MATSRPFAYNTGTGITGTDQVGNLAVGTPTVGFTATGLEWWNGPDEDLGYVIACQVPTDTQPTPVALYWDPNYVGSGNSLSVGNTVVTNSGVNSSVITNRLIGSAEKVMFSFQINQTISSGEIGVGQITMNTGSYVGGGDGKSLSFSSGGTYLYYGGVQSSGLPTWGTVNDIVDVAVNMASGTIYIRVNGGNWNGTRNENPASGGGSLGMAGLTSLYPAITPYQGIATILETATYSVPSGFTFLGQTLASVGFFRSSALTDPSFVSLANVIAGPSGPFASGSAAKTWLNSNGYWTSYVGSTGASGFTVTIVESGGNVVMSASGSLNINDLTLVSGNTGPFPGNGLGISTATFVMGTTPSNYAQYSGFTSTPSNFGTGSGLPPSSSSGDIFGCFYPGTPPHQLAVPVGYTSGANISSVMTFNSQTFSSMGLVQGTYTYAWGSGANADSINVVVGGTGSTGSTGGTGASTGNYNLLNTYSPANSNGSMTFPNHNTGTASSNPNLIGQSGYAIYINQYDLTGANQSSTLDNLLGRSGTLTLTQGSNTVVYSFASNAFGYGGGYSNEYWWDNQFNGSPLGTITVTQSASGNFNFTDPITITVS